MCLFDCKGAYMKWKWTLPYIFSGAALMIGPGLTTAQNDGDAALIPTNNTHRVSYVRTLRYDISVENKINKIYLDTKADSLRDIYVSNMLRAQEKLHPLMGRSGYRAAVRRELPGAPVGMHCVWGQYTHLSRALDEMGDTITIIPDGARTACAGFKYHMDKKYNTPDFPDCIHNGVMHETDSAYNAALDKYLARNRVNADTPDSVRAEHVQKFASRNFSADGLDAGAILIVPRYRGSRSKFHAVMYLGRGRLDDGKFIPDSTGRHIYVGHNRENLGDIFKTYDVSNVFAADNMRNILAAGRYDFQNLRLYKYTIVPVIVITSALVIDTRLDADFIPRLRRIDCRLYGQKGSRIAFAAPVANSSSRLVHPPHISCGCSNGDSGSQQHSKHFCIHGINTFLFCYYFAENQHFSFDKKNTDGAPVLS